MTHCVSCDKNLNDFEATRKIVREDTSVEYIDMCNSCYKESGIKDVAVVVERLDLVHETDVDEYEEIDYDTLTCS